MSSPASAADAQAAARIVAACSEIPPHRLRDVPAGDYYDAIVRVLRDRLAPPPLPGVPGDAILAVAPVPGKLPERWRYVAPGAWIAWPHAEDGIHAEEMTAAQLRAILAARDTR